MKKIFVTTVLVIFWLFSSGAEAQPQVRVALAQGYAVTLPDGGLKALPPATILGLTLNMPIEESWGWAVEVAFATPNAIFHPNPRAYGGLYRKWNAISLGGGIVYQHVVGYGEGKSAEQVWLAIAPGFAISKEVAFIFPLGGGKTISGGPWFVNGGPRLSFLLPF